MNNYKYLLYTILCKVLRLGNKFVVEKLRSSGIEIGDNTHVFSNIASSEPYLVHIGSNCTIATEVNFITHDACIGAIGDRNEASDVCGQIRIGDNCFIGNRSIIMYGVSLADNTIVAAGSVVTKSVNEPGLIIGGNPAKTIGSISQFKEKYKDNFLKLHGLNKTDRKNAIINSGKLIAR